MDDYLKVLRQYWGYDSFRGIQQEIIESIGSGKDTLGLMPTGGGKSITFQVPALCRPGICLVITPLIALMIDQVTRLRSMGIKATAIHSGMSHDQILATLENCIFGDYKFLYVSPERLKSDIFLIKLHHMHVSFITVDEAHCISQWGYDFRPSYREIAFIRQELSGIPVLALTATATPKVVDDIQDKLEFPEKNVKKMSFQRNNLAYIIRKAEDKPRELLRILNSTEGSTIIYVRNREATRTISQWLRENGISAIYYHAGLYSVDKDQRQEMWKEGGTRVMVATNAFGMGIDKADVRLVIHFDVPDSIEAYFQEAGRAGRDGKKAEAIMLVNRRDSIQLRKHIQDAFPDKDYIRAVYEDIACYFQLAVGDGYAVTYEFNKIDFCKKFHHQHIRVESALSLLSKAGYLIYQDEDDSRSRVMFMLQKEELYHIRRMTPENERLILAILRKYAGAFSQYVYIEEKVLAEETGISAENIYLKLKALNQQQILHYIPRKNIPYITFCTRRVETKEIVLNKEIYDERKQDYTKRIQAITHYIEEDDECRVNVLLRYFGEESHSDCEQCDICLNKQALDISDPSIEKAADALVQIMADGKPHSESDFQSLPFTTLQIQTALKWLLKGSEIVKKKDLYLLD